MAKIPIILEPGRADGKLIKTNSVYDDNQEKFLSDKIKEIDNNHNGLKDNVNTLTEVVNNNESDIENKLETEKTRATNSENNLRETINNITEISGSATTANIVTIDTIPNSSSSNVQQALNELFNTNKELNNAIAAEQERADAAEQANATAIDAAVAKNEEQDQKLSELENIVGQEGTKEDGSSTRGKLYVTDESGNVVAVIYEEGVKSLDFMDKDGNKLSQMVPKVKGKGLSTNDLTDELVKRIKSSVSNTNIIDDRDGFYICDGEGNVAFKIDRQGNVDYNGQSAGALNKKNLFTLCDSLGTSGIWQNKLAELTGMEFDNTINTDKKFPLSVGGTTTSVSGTGTLQRALYLVEHWAKEKSIDVVIVENINDMTTKIGYKADAPWMLSQQITLDTINANSGAAETYFRSNIATICAGITPKFGTTINVPYYARDGSKKITISSKASSNGKIIITCAGIPYEVDVTTSDNIETIVDKIVEYDFSNGQFSASKLSSTEVIMTTVTGASLSMNVGTTSVGYSITDTKGVATLSFCYKGETLDTWSTLAKWQEQVGDNVISLYSKIKGLFGYLCNKLPNAKIFMGLFPRMTSSQNATYKNADGTYNIDKFYEDNAKYLNVAKCQAECAEMFGVTVLDMWKESGFSIANSPAMYEGGSGVHPGRVGYERIGETIARLINY